MNARLDIDSPRIHECRNDDAWTWNAAVAIAGALRRALQLRTGQAHPRARLLLSGGTTPAPVFRALSQAPLEWERIDVGLVDERWLRPGDADSNAYLVQKHLLRNHAAAARFDPIMREGVDVQAAVDAANLRARTGADVVVLGMGDDGHTASLFPGMQGLGDALGSPEAYVAVDASGCAGAGSWSRRISLTPAGLAPAGARFLLLRGERKRQVFQRALAGSDPLEIPVRIAFTTPGAPLDVYWCE